MRSVFLHVCHNVCEHEAEIAILRTMCIDLCVKIPPVSQMGAGLIRAGSVSESS